MADAIQITLPQLVLAVWIAMTVWWITFLVCDSLADRVLQHMGRD